MLQITILGACVFCCKGWKTASTPAFFTLNLPSFLGTSNQFTDWKCTWKEIINSYTLPIISHTFPKNHSAFLFRYTAFLLLLLLLLALVVSRQSFFCLVSHGDYLEGRPLFQWWFWRNVFYPEVPVYPHLVTSLGYVLRTLVHHPHFCKFTDR